MGVCRLQLIVCLITATAVLVVAQNDIRQPPNIEDPVVPQSMYKTIGSDFSVTCRATGKPKPTYEWRFGDRTVTAQNPPGGNVSFSQVTGQLHFAGLTEQQTGVYTCRASNSHATAMGPKINVQLSYLGTWPSDNPRDRSVKATEGSYARIECDPKLPYVSGPNNFKWYRRQDRNDEVRPGERVFIDEKGTLHFTMILPEDDQLNPSYSCALSNTDTGNIVMGTKINLEVSSRDGPIPPSQPVLRYPGVDQLRQMVTVVRGRRAHLECFFSGNPSPNVTWKDAAGKVIIKDGNYEFDPKGRVLTIKQVQLADDTTFTCEGTNNQGTARGTIKVNVTSAPVWERGLVSQTVPEVRNVLLSCRAKSLYNEHPPHPPSWFKNGNPMSTQSTAQYQFSDQDRTLTLFDVTKRDSIACYQCLVQNSVGEVYGEGCLNVILPINITTQPAPDQEISKGDVINLTVKATSDPLYPVSYQWLFRNQTYSKEEAPPFVLYDVQSLQASLNTSQLSEDQLGNVTGLYRRVVAHQYQRREVDVLVTLRVDPGPAAAGFQYWIIGLILAILIILLILIICCCVICRRKMQEGDYPVDKKETAAGLDPEKEVKDSAFPDLSRADDPYSKKKKAGQQDMDGESLADGDESFGSAEYMGDEPSAFNEDGSFIGAYQAKAKPSKQPAVNQGFHSSQPQLNHSHQSYGSESMV